MSENAVILFTWSKKWLSFLIRHSWLMMMMKRRRRTVQEMAEDTVITVPITV